MSKIDNLTSIDLEKQIVSSLIKFNEVIYELDHILDANCFSNSFLSCCFSVLKDAAQKKEKIDKNILAQRLINIGLSKYEEIDSFSFIDSISYNSLADKEVLKVACNELIKLKS